MKPPFGLREKGLTLMELLVTLVIVSMVAAVLSQALYQFQRAERLMSSERMQAQLTRLHRLWVADAVRALLPGTQASPDEFAGTDSRWNGLSNAAPLPGAQGPTRVTMALRPSPDGGFELAALPWGSTANESGVVLLSWAPGGERPQWRYLDDKGRWVQAWPQLGQPAGVSAGLPEALALVRGEELVVLAGVQVSALPLGRRIDLEKLP